MQGRPNSGNNNNNNNNNSNDDIKIPVNKLALYGRNVKGTFFGGYLEASDNYAAVLFNVFHTLLLPLSLTVGAGAKTVVDIATREPLTVGQVNEMLEQVKNMDD